MTTKVNVAILFSALCSASALPAQVPVARAKSEFRELVPFIKSCAEKNRGDTEMFKRLVLPYGPLDLEVRKATHHETAELRNFYLGVAGGAFGIDPRLLTNGFHCGPVCTANRRNDLREKMPNIERLVSSFRGLGKVRVLSTWGIGNDFRVNELFQIMDKPKLTQPSSVMGFVPSGAWQAVDPDKYISSLGTNNQAVRSILDEMRSLGLAALVKEDDQKIRVVRVGISENESGLIFSTAPRPPYREGEELQGGRTVTVTELLKPNVFFYETT